MKSTKLFFYLLVTTTIITSCGSEPKKQNDMNKEMQDFITAYEAKVKPLIKDMNLAYFDAAVTGKEEAYQKSAKLELEVSKIFANKQDFAKLKELKESGKVTDPLLKRQLYVLYNSYLSQQIDEKKMEEMINLSTQIEQKYSIFRAEVNGKKLTDNDVEEILSTSTKDQEVKDAWLSVKKIGPVVATDIIKIVKMRNEVAKSLGFSNYHEMSLKLGDQDPAEISKIFDELDNLTRDAFAGLKNDIDDFLAKRFNISKDKLMPWHYQNRFFQEAPQIYNVDLDGYYKKQDVVELTSKFFSGIGLDITDLLKNSDLYEKEGKNQHAFCSDIDNEGDVRVLCNVKPNAKWMNTMLHEFGHASYDKYIDSTLPYSLREPAHTFTTEAIAMIMGRFASNPQWIKDMTGISEQEKTKIAEESFKSLRLEQLVFSRWAQVMYRFEKGLYENPDQDLNKLWWNIVEKYQMIKRPADRNEPDWATKVHIATSPCYYHNYLLGELLASQLFYTISDKVLKTTDYKSIDFVNKPEVGKFLIDKVFFPGSKWYWNDMIENATGEKLTAKYYAKQFVN